MPHRLRQAVEVSEVEVDTVLRTRSVQPGQPVLGVVRLRGGYVRKDIERIALSLVARFEMFSSAEEPVTFSCLHSIEARGGFALEPKQQYDVDFELPTPFETPISVVGDLWLSGMSVELRTFVDIASTRYAADRSPIAVCPLPAQVEILAALADLGFRVQRSGAENGWAWGIQQELAFHQRIELDGSVRYPTLGELVITFVAGVDGVEVVLDAERGCGDRYGALYVEHADIGRDDISRVLQEQLSKLSNGR